MGIHIAAAAAWLPAAESAKAAVAAGDYTQDELTVNGILCVPTAGADDPPPRMAALAGRTALDRAGSPRADVVLHASLYHQGRDYFWSPASYVQRELTLDGAFSVNVGQMSNGGLAAFELGVGQVASGRAEHVLLTTADRFCGPGFARWSADYGIVYGDGATAMVLSCERGFASVLSLRSLTDPSLEMMHRGTDPLTSTVSPGPVDVRGAKRSYLGVVGLESILERSAAGIRHVVDKALADAGCGTADLAKVVLPNLGHQLLAVQYLAPLGITADRTLMDWGAHTGHLGAGDQLGGVARLVEARLVEPGDRVLLLGAGGGFSWTAAVLEIDEVPDWAHTARVHVPAEVAG